MLNLRDPDQGHTKNLPVIQVGLLSSSEVSKMSTSSNVHQNLTQDKQDMKLFVNDTGKNQTAKHGSLDEKLLDKSNDQFTRLR